MIQVICVRARIVLDVLLRTSVEMPVLTGLSFCRLRTMQLLVILTQHTLIRYASTYTGSAALTFIVIAGTHSLVHQELSVVMSPPGIKQAIQLTECTDYATQFMF